MNEFILKNLQFNIETQKDDGSFPAGHNGPYLDPEKPTRNTAHILYMLASLYEAAPSEEVKSAAERSIEYLFSKEVRPHSASFYCRDKQGKDHCNGLMGQAWVIEALVKASKVFGYQECYRLAEDVYLQHKFNDSIGIWHRLEINDSTLSFDPTFNHQLWFASAAAQLDKTPIAQKQALNFLNKVAADVTLYSNGVIFHNSPMGACTKYISLGMRKFFGQIKSRCFIKRKMPDLYLKSVGYHGFNLYAYAILKEAFPDEVLWKSELINKILEVTDNIEFQNELQKSDFGYFYNLSGVEIAYAMEVLCEDYVKAQKWVDRQFEFTYESEKKLFTRHVVDKNTAMARVYQLTRLKYNYEVKTGGS